MLNLPFEIVFTTTAKLVHRFSLPPTISFASIIAILRDHDWLIRLDPELDSYTLCDTSNSSTTYQTADKEEYEETKNPRKTKTYKVTDHMNGIPKSIYDAKVHVGIQITDVDEGVDFLVHAPMGVVQRGRWRVVVVDEAWQLAIETEITCSRLLMGIVKGKAESNAPMMGRALVELLEKEQDG